MSLAGRHRFYDFGAGVAETLKAGRTLWIDDTRSDDRSRVANAAYESIGVRSVLAVPLVKDGDLAIAFFVQDADPRRWTDRDEALLREVAERTWAAVERARAEAALRDSDERQTFLLKLSDALRPLTDPMAIQRVAARSLGEHLGASRVFYVVVDPDGDSGIIDQDYADGLPSRTGRYSLSAFSTAALADWRAGRTASSDDVQTDPRYSDTERSAYASVSTRAGFGVPLIKGGRLAALLGVNQSMPRRWTDSDFGLAREVAERTWDAVERARAENALRDSETIREVAIAANEEFDAEIEVASGPAAGRWLRWRGRAAPGDTSVLYGVSFDITEQKRAEAALRKSEARLRDVLDSMTDGFALLDPDFTILDVNEETLRLDGRGRDELVGHTHWAAFPGSEDLPIGETFKRVMRDRAPAAIEHEYRWPDGRSLWIDARAYPTIEGGIAVFWRDITDRKQTEAALRDTQEQQRLMLQLAPALLWSADPAGREITLNQRWTNFTGQSDAETQDFGWLDAIHPDDLPATQAAFAHAIATGEPVEREHRVHKAGDGYRWHLVRHVPLRDDAGAIVRWFGAAIDIDELRRLQDLQKTLLAELQHRVRNILAVIRSMMRRSSETQESLADYVQHLEGRISALARTQVLLTRSVDARVDLEDLIRDELLAQAADETRINLSGPQVTLGPKAAEVLALAVHELTTNAVKYGALSRASATLQVSWQVEERANAPWLHFTWSEVGVAVASSAPRREGFGSELITRRVPYELKGKGSLEMRPGGIICELEFPLKDRASILQTDARTGEMAGSK